MRYLTQSLGLAAMAMALLITATSAGDVETIASAGCLEGHVYLTVAGESYGITQTTCFVSTDCGSELGAGPAFFGTGSAQLNYYVSIPVPNGTDVACYV